MVLGPTIKHTKQWNFKNLKTGTVLDEINNNMIRSKRFEVPGEYLVWINIVEFRGGKPVIVESGLNLAKRIKVLDETKIINTFNQWQGVIIQGDYVGFSATAGIDGVANYKWIWGDEKPGEESGWGKQNPHHQYKRKGVWGGTLTVQGEPEPTETRNFGVLVLPSPFELGGVYDIHCYIRRRDKRQMPMPPNTDIHFIGSSTGGIAPFTYTWDFGNGDTFTITAKKEDDRMPQQKKTRYKNPGLYETSLTITDSQNYKIVITKDVIIEKQSSWVFSLIKKLFSLKD